MLTSTFRDFQQSTRPDTAGWPWPGRGRVMDFRASIRGKPVRNSSIPTLRSRAGIQRPPAALAIAAFATQVYSKMHKNQTIISGRIKLLSHRVS